MSRFDFFRVIPVEKELVLRQGEEILNGVILDADIEAMGHFGNQIGLELRIETSRTAGLFMAGYGFTITIGFVVKAIVETVKDLTDNNTSFSSLKGCPVRVILKNNRLTGIGHFYKDRWLRVDAIEAWTDEMAGEKDE